jgi:hypothetical protein
VRGLDADVDDAEVVAADAGEERGAHAAIRVAAAEAADRREDAERVVVANLSWWASYDERVRGGWLMIGLAACGHATPPAEPEPHAEHAVVARVIDAGVRDAGKPDASQDEELKALLPSNDPANAPLTMKTALPRIVIAAGPVPGAPALVVERTPDPTHCGGEDVVVRFDRGVPPALDPALVVAMTIATSKPNTWAELRAWVDDAGRRAHDATDLFDQRIAAASGLPRVEAEARRVLVMRHYYDAFLHQRPLSSVAVARTPGGPPSIVPFCDQLAKNVTSGIRDLEEAAAKCRADAANIGVGPGWWDVACAVPGP